MQGPPRRRLWVLRGYLLPSFGRRYACQYSHDNIGHYYCLVERVSACAEPPAAVVTPSAEAHSRAAAAHNRTNRVGIGLRHVRTSVRGDANFSAVSVYGCEGYTLPDRCDGSGRVGSARCESECVSARRAVRLLACMCVCVRLIGGQGKRCRGYAAIMYSWLDKLVLLGDMLQRVRRRVQRGLAVPVPSRKAENPAAGASPAVPPWKHCITLLAVFVVLLAVFVPLLAVFVAL